MSNKPTLCILTDYMILGGVESVICDALPILSKNFDITIVSFFGNIAPEIKNRTGNYAHFASLKQNKLGAIIAQLPIIGSLYLKHVIKDNFDYLITVKSTFLLVSNSGIANKTIFWNHGDKDIMYDGSVKLNFARRLNKLRLQMGYRNFDTVWCLSDQIKQRITRAFDLENTFVLSNPLYCEDIIRKSHEPSPVSFPSNDGLRIVTVSRLSEEKGQIRLIKAIEEVSKEYPCMLTIVGDGPCRKHLEDYVAQHQLQEQVILVGKQVNPYPFVAAADLFVLPSKAESFGLAAAEAMLLGTPVVVTDTSGGRFVTVDGTLGILTENSERGIVDGIKEYIINTEKYRQLIPRAQARALEFDKLNFEKNILILISELG